MDSVGIERLPLNEDEFPINSWNIKYQKSHILHSMCSKSGACNPQTLKQDLCLFCLYSSTLPLPHLPDMVFPTNKLILQHKSGAKLEFNAYDALKDVVVDDKPLQVSCAEAWQETRPGVENYAKPFDWTFTTQYQGTKLNFQEETTHERIDMELLKQADKMLFFNELTLYEDELHDHGVATLGVKIRVMPDYFFVLLRYFMRLDNVLVKLHDTRVFHMFKTNYLLQEYTEREMSLTKTRLPISVLIDPNQLQAKIPLKTQRNTKLVFNLCE